MTSSFDSLGSFLESRGAKRTFFSTSACALSRIASETSTATAWMPCSTRSVMAPTPMFPAPITPTFLNSIYRVFGLFVL